MFVKENPNRKKKKKITWWLLLVTGGYCSLALVIAYTKKYLQSDCQRGVQYWPYLGSVFDICIFSLNKKKYTTFESCCGKIEMYSLKPN